VRNALAVEVAVKRPSVLGSTVVVKVFAALSVLVLKPEYLAASVVPTIQPVGVRKGPSPGAVPPS
jgi:hypothetical protein